LISVIMPAYNAGKYIGEAIESVLRQSYSHWELIVVDDGSYDRTADVVSSFTDARIRYLLRAHNGVSAARNAGLESMQGTFFCFLDADDMLPEKSLEARLKILLNDEKVLFADGVMETRTEDLKLQVRISKPRFSGNPFGELLKLSDSCFLGNTWMIRRVTDQDYHFEESINHGEELIFYLSISKKGEYAFTDETVLIYRRHNMSAMRNLKSLEKGYRAIIKYAEDHTLAGRPVLRALKKKVRRIIFRSYLKEGEFRHAILFGVSPL
jgi:teichuronic acid biosynthesis glycosyltransferase TuaG